ncbi:hypothetical protein BKN38_06345 [Helicobacter sp. CLO-3]|nr:hypothetical protein BKN38_06345 [Helicobacter sp. CLO-3]
MTKSGKVDAVGATLFILSHVALTTMPSGTPTKGISNPIKPSISKRSKNRVALICIHAYG